MVAGIDKEKLMRANIARFCDDFAKSIFRITIAALACIGVCFHIVLLTVPEHPLAKAEAILIKGAGFRGDTIAGYVALMLCGCLALMLAGYLFYLFWKQVPQEMDSNPFTVVIAFIIMMIVVLLEDIKIQAICLCASILIPKAISFIIRIKLIIEINKGGGKDENSKVC